MGNEIEIETIKRELMNMSIDSPDIFSTLCSLVPAPKMIGTVTTKAEYESVNWLDERVKPTYEEIEEKWKELYQDSFRLAAARLLSTKLTELTIKHPTLDVYFKCSPNILIYMNIIMKHIELDSLDSVYFPDENYAPVRLERAEFEDLIRAVSQKAQLLLLNPISE